VSWILVAKLTVARLNPLAEHSADWKGTPGVNYAGGE
jgi:hypothetical protein